MGDQTKGQPRRPDCVLCGCCLEGCPLLATTGREELSPRAKALLAGPSKASLGALDDEAVAELAGLCLACGKCEKLCPQGVKVPELVARLRAEHPRFRQWLWKQWITRLAPFWGAAATGAGIVPEAVIKALVPSNFGLAVKGLKGLKPGGGLRPWLKVTRLPVEAFREKYGARRVALFHGCVGSGPKKRWADTATALMRGLMHGEEANLVAANFSCCGSTLGVAGLPQEQRTARLANVQAWRRAGKPLLVTYCATCHKGLLDYDGIFESDAEAREWKAAVTPLSALLAGMTVKAGKGAPTLAAWHEPCHAPKSDMELVKALLGNRLRAPAAAKCCGFGGIMQLGAPQLSEQVGADCWAGLLKATGSDQAGDPSRMVVPPLALTSCSGCVMQLLSTAPAGAPSGAVVGHWLEIITPG